jgi:5'-phosphate synthase pdxT subunit
VPVGVLAVQGAFARHAEVLRSLGLPVVLVRSPSELAAVDGLVLPGGESTVQLEMIARLGLEAEIRALVARGAPVLATCAGLVLLAREVESPRQRSFGLVDVAVARNAWGRQVDSFEATSDEGRPLVFIRAPRIVRVSPGVTVLARFRGEPVLVRQGAVTCATYHPELTDDASLHAQVFTSSARASCPPQASPEASAPASPAAGP